MVLPGSMNIAPPPEMRRTTSMPCLAAPSGSTSLRTDWNEPMTTSGLSQSQNRSVGGRSPAATSRAMTSSSATCRAGSSTRAGMTSKSWSSHPVALPRARRIAMPIDSAVKPMSETSSASAPLTAPASCSTPASTGMPRQRRVDVAERLVGLEEEVARDADVREPAVRPPRGRPPRACHREPCTHHACQPQQPHAADSRMPTCLLARLPPRALGPVRARAATRPRTTAPWPRRSRTWSRGGRGAGASLRRTRRARRARGAASRGRAARIASRQSRVSRTWTCTLSAGSQPTRGSACPSRQGPRRSGGGCRCGCRRKTRSRRPRRAARTSARPRRRGGGPRPGRR